MHCLVYWLTDATAGRHSSLTHLIQSYSNLTRAVRKVNTFQHIVVCLTKPIFRYEIVFVCFSSVTRRMPVTHPSCSWVCFAQYMLLWSILSTSVCLYIRFLLFIALSVLLFTSSDHPFWYLHNFHLTSMWIH